MGTRLLQAMEDWAEPGNEATLVSRPRPLMRRNVLVNQVKFLVLAHTFGQCNITMFKTLCRQTRSTKSMNTRMEMNKFYCCKGSTTVIIITDLAISLVVTAFG